MCPSSFFLLYYKALCVLRIFLNKSEFDDMLFEQRIHKNTIRNNLLLPELIIDWENDRR